MKPSDFDKCNDEDKQKMMANMIAHAEMDAVDYYIAEKEREKEIDASKNRKRR